MEPISALMQDARERAQLLGRPLVTLSYAQSLDGCLAARRGEGLAISGAETKLLAHRLRAANDAIMVGIETVLADDPHLTARLAGGPHPQPVILDSRLRLPLDAALLKRDDCSPWVFCSPDSYADSDRLQRLERSGACVKPARILPDGFLDLRAVLDCLFQNGLRTLMVEGGARVLSSFLGFSLGDQALITIAPFWAGGDAHLELPRNNRSFYPHLEQAEMGVFGQDWVVWGKIGEKNYASSSPVFHSPEPG